MNFKNDLQTGILLIPVALVNDEVISDKAKMVAFRLLAVGKTLNKDKLAKSSGFSVETLNKYLKELEVRGWLTLVKVPKKIDTYVFNFEPEPVAAPEYKINPEVKPVDKTVLADAIALYHEFYLKKVGVKPLIDGAGVQSIKKIIEYFDKNVGESKIILSFKAIFDNWNLIDPFLGEQLKPQQIFSNLANILNQVKNGYSKNKPAGGSSNKSTSEKIGNF